MQDDIAFLRESLREGKYCAVALMEVALHRSGVRDDLLLRAMSGLCSGLQGGLLCGALSGAVCMLNVLAPDANDRMVPELVEWFLATVGEEYGGVNCDDILAENPRNHTRCPAIIEATYRMAESLLQKHGSSVPQR
jgi:hypothetical protein